MSNFASSPSVILKGVRLDYFDVWEKGAPIAEKDKADPKKWKYKVKAIFAPDSEAGQIARKAFMEAATALWGPNAMQVVKAMSKNNKAVRNGDECLNTDGSLREEYKGMLIVSGSNTSKPACVGPKKVDNKFVDISADGKAYQNGMEMVPPPYPITAPYRGCYVNLKVQFIAGKAKGEMPNQVYAKFEAIQFVKNGEAFGAGPATAEGFDEEELDGGSLFEDDIGF